MILSRLNFSHLLRSYTLTPAFTMGGIQALMLKTDGIDSKLPLFVTPFDPDAWLAFFLSWILYGTALYLVSFLSQKMQFTSFGGDDQKEKKEKYQAGKEVEFSLYQSMFYFSIGALQFGVENHPKSIPGRILQGS